MFGKLLLSESGNSAMEYGLIAALIAVAIIGTVTVLGGKIKDTFQAIVEAL
jgi:pilus assembly protein Flp/PilA